MNGKLVSLDTALKTGDQVEILTAKRGGPSRDWLNPNLGLVKSQRARSKVRYWFKQQDREQNISQGKMMLEREMRRLSLSEVDLKEVADDFGFRDLDNMYLAIGYGDLGIARVINLVNTADAHTNGLPFHLGEGFETVTVGDDSISVLGLKGLLTTMAKCCKPAPGDEIIGYVTRGRGATIHRRDCPNVLRVKEPERLVQVSWGEASSTFPVAVVVRAYDRDGLLRDVSTVIAEEGINMSQVKVDVNQNQAVFDLILNVGDIEQLSRVLTKVEKLPNVMEARRVKPG